MKNQLSVIVFDLGNVLLPFNYNILIRKLNNLKPGLGNHFYKTYFDNYKIHREFESGKMTETEFISRMLEILGHVIDGKTFCKYFSSIFNENKDVSSLLPGLRKKYKLILLSNTNSIHEEFGWKDYKFLDIFNDLVLSHRVGAVKPEEKIYRQVEKVSGYPSDQHIFIDDIKDYVLAAKRIGWDGIHFENSSKLLVEFEKRKII